MPRSTGPGVVALVAARYELVRELRVDGDRVEWEAFDSALERPVVVQRLRPEFAHDPGAVERFRQAARSAARGAASVGERVLDAGTDPETGQFFVVREWPAASSPDPSPRTLPSSAQMAREWEYRPRWLIVSGAVIGLVLVGAMIRPGVESWLAWVNTPLARSNQGLGLAPAVAVPTSGVQPVQSTSAATAAPTAIPTRAPTATAVPAGQTRRIVNTDGRGVALRTSPGGDRLPAKGYDEGATVQAFEQSGEWTRIRGSDGREGWVLSVTLAP